MLTGIFRFEVLAFSAFGKFAEIPLKKIQVKRRRDNQSVSSAVFIKTAYGAIDGQGAFFDGFIEPVEAVEIAEKIRCLFYQG